MNDPCNSTPNEERYVARSASASVEVFADFHADVGECLRVLRPAVISAASCSVRERSDRIVVPPAGVLLRACAAWPSANGAEPALGYGNVLTARWAGRACHVA